MDDSIVENTIVLMQRIRLEIQTYHSAQGYIKVLFPSKKVDKSKWGMSLYHRIHDWTDSIVNTSK